MRDPRSSSSAPVALRALALVLALANSALVWQIWLVPQAESSAAPGAAPSLAQSPREIPAAANPPAAPGTETAASGGDAAPARAALSDASAAARSRELGSERATRAPEPPPPLEGTLLFGRVRSSDGRMPSGATGWIYGPGQTKHLASVRPEVHGHYAVAGLPSGTLRIRLRAEGHSELEQLVEVPPGTPELELDLVLERTRFLAVKLVTPEGRPLHAALAERGMRRGDELSVVATRWEPSGDLPSTVAREPAYGIPRWVSAQGPGSFGSKPQVSRDHAGHFELTERGPLFVSALLRNALLATARVAPEQDEVVLTIPVERIEERLATLRLRVVDALTRAPLDTAQVGLALRGSAGPGTQVDAEGRLELTRRAPGTWRLTVSTEGYAGLVSEVDLPPGELLDLGDVLLTTPSELRVRCTDASGDAKALSVSARSLDAPSHPQLAPHTLRLQRDGELFTAQVPRGRYLVRATGAGTAAIAVESRELGSEPIVLSLAPEAMLRPRLATPGELLRLTVIDASGFELASDWLPSGPPSAWRVPVGSLRLLVKLRSGEQRERVVEVPPNGLELVLPE